MGKWETMGKKRRGLLEDMMELVSRMPWWAGIVVAVVGYVVLHRMATAPAVPVVGPGQIGNVIVQSAIAGLATAGQYIVPLVGLAGTALSIFRRKKRIALVADMADSKSASALNGMTWREFEMLVGQAYRMQGYHVTETGGGADGGIDLVLTKGNERFLVQCKQWKAFKVGVEVVRELYGVMAAQGATGGVVVTSGRFTEDAKQFANGRNMDLVDGTKLFALIQQAKRPVAATSHPSIPKPIELQTSTQSAPACPQCGSSMTQRTARKGSHAGNIFWGCKDFPVCRGIRKIDGKPLLTPVRTRQ